ncbi:MAG: tripartite tricarboxylate transporter substrate binding protein [Rhodovarius sp.]|nr:tripartite tricarboxylate transporter substrate binding protein [Rhodovarius sp.]MCX7932304.1 tripartite tricarboxylate transporter substrate binding protein [Rhodovarius sp.]MDW8314601.1 tripartite tricarboxylate transporter substrate binding protein [Rhodovarius sp.]
MIRPTRRALLALPALTAPALGQAPFPTSPIRLFCPWPPGGTTDVQMRALAEAASRRLGQPVVVENRPGAGGVLGAQALLTARPDGYTISQMPISVFRQPLLNSRPLFDPLTDFTYIVHLTGYLFGTVVRHDAPWRSLGELIEHARRHPGRITYGTPGVGTSLHLTMELIAQRAGIEWTHVPFRGFSENIQSLLAGQTDVLADSSAWAPLALEGRVRVLATWGPERAKRFPEVPTLRESGFDIVSASPYGFAGPRGMEPRIVRILQDAFLDALMDPAHLQVLDRFDMVPMPLDAAAYRADVERIMREERELITRLGIRLS